MPARVDADSAMKLATDIVVAYLGQGGVEPTALPALVRDVLEALMVGAGGAEVAGALARSGPAGSRTSEPPSTEPARARLPIEETITDDHLVCLEDGKKFKSLRRHLMAHHGLTPEEYRRKWDLPADYPMVAANYSSVRSELARQIGFASAATRATEAATGRPRRAASARG